MADELAGSYIAPDPAAALMQVRQAAKQMREAEATIERHAKAAGPQEAVGAQEGID